jgi:hypothetical protein
MFLCVYEANIMFGEIDGYRSHSRSQCVKENIGSVYMLGTRWKHVG